MADPTVIAARRYGEQHPGYRLAYADEVAVPVSLLTLDVLAQQRKPLPLVDEFVLRLADYGIHRIENMAAVLGIDRATVSDAVTAQLSAETVEYRPDTLGSHRVRLTHRGKIAVDDLCTITPQRIEHQHSFDRMLWKPIPHGRPDLITRGDAEARGLLRLPSARTSDVSADDVTARVLNQLLDRGRDDDSRPAVEILSVEAVIRQPRLYLPAVLLVYVSDTGDDHRFNVIVDDTLSEAHDNALHHAGGLDRTKIKIAAAPGEPELPAPLRRQRAPYTIVRDLQRRADSPLTDDPAVTRGSASPQGQDSDTARAELHAMTVRSVPLFEHRELLATALDTTRNRFLLAAPWVRDAVVTDDFIAKLEMMLRRSGMTAHIGYGLGQDIAHNDKAALNKLRQLARRYDRLTIAHILERQPNILIFDDTWVNTGFDWLSFRDQPTRTYRPHEGTLIREKTHVDQKYLGYVDLMDRSAAAQGR